MEGNHGPTFNNGFILYDFGVQIHVNTYVLISFIYAFGYNLAFLLGIYKIGKLLF